MLFLIGLFVQYGFSNLYSNLTFNQESKKKGTFGQNIEHSGQMGCYIFGVGLQRPNKITHVLTPHM
jgi:hypothetical protein